MSGAKPSAGVSFLEVVFAAGMLSAAAASITAAFSSITRFAERQEARLAATEVAHRLLLQYLDDPAMLKPERDVFELGRGRFRYMLNRQVLTDEQAGAEDVSIRRTAQAQSLGFMDKLKNRLQMVTVEVYEDVNGKRGRDPLATLSRIYDPLGGAEDDPEAWIRQVANLFEDDPVIQQLFLGAIEAQRKQQELLRQAQQGAGAAQPGGATAPRKKTDESPRRIGVPGGSTP